MGKSKRGEQPKGMSPKHARRAHVTRSTGNDEPIFCVCTLDAYLRMSPNDQKAVRDDTKKKLDYLQTKAKWDANAAKRRLIFPGEPGSSAGRARDGSPKKNNKGEPVLPDSPDCGLSPWDPARDGIRSSKRIAAYSPSPEKGKTKQAKHVD